jgi:hypothetical protein
MVPAPTCLPPSVKKRHSAAGRKAVRRSHFRKSSSNEEAPNAPTSAEREKRHFCRVAGGIKGLLDPRAIRDLIELLPGLPSSEVLECFAGPKPGQARRASVGAEQPDREIDAKQNAAEWPGMGAEPLRQRVDCTDGLGRMDLVASAVRLSLGSGHPAL